MQCNERKMPNLGRRIHQTGIFVISAHPRNLGLCGFYCGGLKRGLSKKSWIQNPEKTLMALGQGWSFWIMFPEIVLGPKNQIQYSKFDKRLWFLGKGIGSIDRNFGIDE